MWKLSLILASIVGVSAAGEHAANGDRSVAHLSEISAMVRLPGGSGSGVFVTVLAEHGVTRSFVWTAGHVAEGLMNADGSYGNATICVEYRKDGKVIGESSVEARVHAHDPGHGKPDLALLEVLTDNYLPLSVSASFYGGEVPGVGVEVCHMGCTLGFYNSYSEGVISQTDVRLRGGDEEFDQTTVMAYPGSSGGGVYLLEGKELIGILVRGSGPGLNFIVPARVMREWAIAHGVPWAIDPSLYLAPFHCE